MLSLSKLNHNKYLKETEKLFKGQAAFSNILKKFEIEYWCFATSLTTFGWPIFWDKIKTIWNLFLLIKTVSITKINLESVSVWSFYMMARVLTQHF